MEIRKHISVLVPRELVYLFDADHDHLFVVARERGRIVARPAEEQNASKDCIHFTDKRCADCSLCRRYEEESDLCRFYGRE